MFIPSTQIMLDAEDTVERNKRWLRIKGQSYQTMSIMLPDDAIECVTLCDALVETLLDIRKEAQQELLADALKERVQP